MVMKYGKIAGNGNTNAMIYRCFEHICEEDERKFVRKFHEQPDDSDQIMHTFRELVLGAYLGSIGFKVRHDHVIDNQTPDWSILDVEEESIIGVVELTNFHIDKAAEDEIEGQMCDRGLAKYWRDKNQDNIERLYHVIWNKAQVYKSLIEEHQIPYVVSVFSEFKAAVDLEEVRLCLLDEKTGLFSIYQGLSGVLYFEERFEHYLFKYVSNPNALRAMELPGGVFPPEVA